jgi:hypothetical protein
LQHAANNETISMTKSIESMKKRQKDSKGIPAFKDKEAYQRELGLEQERIRRKRAVDSLKESEEREALEKAGQGNLFTTQREGVLS